MKKKIYFSVTVLAFIVVLGINLKLNTSIGNKFNWELTLNNIEGNANIFEDILNWWNELEYRCERRECTREWSIIIYSHTSSGYAQTCLAGNEAAHCWDCSSCDAAWY